MPAGEASAGSAEKRRRALADDDQEVKLPERPPQLWIDAFTGAMDGVLDLKLQPLMSRLGTVESKVETTNNTVMMMEERLVRLETAPKCPSEIASTVASSDNWQAERIEVRGWCSWSNRNTGGLMRGQVNDVHAKLVECITDQDTKQLIGKPVVYSNKCIYFFIPVDKKVIHEVTDIWRTFLKEHEVPHIAATDGKSPFTRPELSPQRKNQNKVMGKLVNFLGQWSEGRVVTANWYPEFMVAYRMQGEDEHKDKLVAELDSSDAEKVKVKFELPSVTYASMNHISDVELAFRLFKSRN
eukprot:TRINITY_DN46003_c0_g1_i1.p1 TRINITY_DN46003_c0_g1~~TRINITY_DN46003_c0_g1_i1.p1  ORF type:complete len:298 (+),score=46.67 TRINITY_DN46003_c0_g1_i1:241-1134(+)